MENTENNVHVVVTRSTKSVGIGLLLTFLFGAIGMFYATIWGAFLMLVLDVISCFIPVLGWIFVVFVLRPIELIWVAIAIRSYNKKLMKL